MAFASMIRNLFPAFSTGRILKFRMDRNCDETTLEGRWREGEDAEAILPDDCSSIIQPPFCRRCSNVCRLSRSICPRKSVDRSENDSTGFDRIRRFGNFLENVLSINLRKGGEGGRGSKFSFREARLHPIKVVSFGSLPSVR